MVGCPSGAESTDGPTVLGSSTGTAGEETDSSSTGAPPPSDSSDTSTTAPPPADSSSSGSADSSSGGSDDEGCPVGTDGCPCDAGACADTLLCLGDVCQPAQCDGDGFEDNEDEASAHDLGEINDSDDNGGVISGSLHHDGDVDWYRYQGDDDFTGDVDPARTLVSSGGVRMCKFLECDVGIAETEFECPAGTDYAFSPGGRPGCCANGAVELADLNCTGVTEDNAAVYIRIDQPADPCVTYSVAYHY